jgi:hypothetical protein
MGNELSSGTVVQNQNGLPYMGIPDVRDPAKAGGMPAPPDVHICLSSSVLPHICNMQVNFIFSLPTSCPGNPFENADFDGDGYTLQFQ